MQHKGRNRPTIAALRSRVTKRACAYGSHDLRHRRGERRRQIDVHEPGAGVHIHLLERHSALVIKEIIRTVTVKLRL